MENGDPLPYLFDLLSFRRLLANFQIMAATIYIWDFILTFKLELDLVWKSRWTFIKGLYILQRYLPFIEIITTLYFQTGGSLTKSVCWNLAFSSGVMSGVGLTASEMILTLRTWAVWNRNRRLSIILPIFLVLVEGSGLVAEIKYLNSIKYSDPPYPGYKGCFVTFAHKYDLLFISVLTNIWDSLMLILMLVPAARAFRASGNSALVNTVYRDGVIYYLYLFVLSFINTIVLSILPNQQFLMLLARMLRSILTSRVLLDIRVQTEDQPVRFDGLTGLGTPRLRAGDTQFNRLGGVKFSTTNTSL